MNKKYAFLISLALLVGLSFSPVLAKKSVSDEKILPEKDGVYDVPGHPNLKVRVFVHHAKGGKPTPSPTPAPTPTCGLPDDNSLTAEVGRTGWKLSPSVSYQLNSASAPASLGGAAKLGVIVDNAFSAWTSQVNVAVEKAGETALNRAKYDGQWIVAWGRASASTLGITYTWYYPSTGEVAEVDTIMNSVHPWRWSDPATWGESGATCAYADAYDAQNILTHEIGHWFGLTDHYNTADYANHTMYGYGAKKETKKDTLTTGDISGLQAIYSF